MRQHKSLFAQLIVIFSIIFTSLGTPYKVQSEQIEINTPETTQVAPIISEPVVETAVINASTTPAYEIVQNADPYLMSLALGNEEKVSQYGPDRNDPDEGIPDHAYSPFDDLDKREVCPPGGCDYVAGKVLIKFEAEQEFTLTRSNEILLQDQVLASALDTLEITNLSPVFPNAERPTPGEMIETVDGALIEKPDLTRWFQAESTSGKGLGEVIQELQTTAGIAFAEPDFVRKPIGEMTDEINPISQSTLASTLSLPGSTTDPLYDQQWHLGATHVPEAWAYLESQGLPPGGSRDIVVAVIDTGVDYTHPDLAANIWVNPAEFGGFPGVDDDGNGYVDDIHGADTVYPDGNPMDDHGHGTHVAGIIAAQADNGIGGVGVAYNVQVMPIKAAQYSGVLASSDIAEAIYYAVGKGADVINMSFGGYARSTVEEDALAVAFGQAVLVAAAGNDGLQNEQCNPSLPYGAMYPAAQNWVLGVEASRAYQDILGWRAYFSNYDCQSHNSIEYELQAPGVEIWSTLPGSQYAAWSGTSMSAPVVSGIAALARSNWPDKDVYSSRFIMGQIASNTNNRVANALDSLTISPRPELTYLEHWLFDTIDINPINDNDGIVDAGETVDLAIVIRNHWGKADNVTITLEAWAEGAVFPDPYVTMITDTVNYGAVGSFNWDDNGLIYDTEGAIIGVQNPFRFSILSSAPNDHIIPLRLTISATNGYDPLDPQSPYSFTDYFYLVVQKGIQLPQIISSNIDLTNDKLWIIDQPVLIESGVSVNVDPGTQIQFWSNEPSDPYSVITPPYLQVEGELFINGNQTDPVEIFPSFAYSDYITEIRKKPGGIVKIFYTHSINPVFGMFIQNTYQMINLIDHSKFQQSSDFIYTLNTYGNRISREPGLQSEIFRNSIIDKVGGNYIEKLLIFSGSSNLYNGCVLKYDMQEMPYPRYSLNNNVFLKNYRQLSNSIASSTIGFSGTRTYKSTFLKPAAPLFFSGKTYFVIPIFYTPLDVAEDFAQFLGGHLVSISDLSENDLVTQYFSNLASNISSETDCGYIDCKDLYTPYLWIGLSDTNNDGIFEWTNGEDLNYTNWYEGYPIPDPDTGSVSRKNLVKIDNSGFWLNDSDVYQLFVGGYGSWLLEVPGEVPLADLEISSREFINGGDFGHFQNNAILNQYINSNPNTWMRFSPTNPISNYIESRYIDWFNTNNYWGTTSRTLIDASIFDNKDDFNLPNFIYEPIQDFPSEEIYPFVYDINLSIASDPNASVVGAEPVTFTVTFNRDMDQAVQPQVSFGPDIPMTDYTVHPIDGGWTDARTWVGTFNVNPVTGDGYQLIRVAGAVAADDPWLVTGDDAGRFRFEVITSGTEAMNLQATGGEGYVDLMWTQTDFDLLAGFNLYRSTTLDGPYTRINSSIIPPETRTYRDTDVIPGQPYYYKFTVVKSDMTESDFSNTATATPLDTIPPTLTHTPVTSAEPGQPLTLTASATDNVNVSSVTLYFRHVGDVTYLSAPMVETTADQYYATIAGSYLTSPGVEYYIEATDGISITRNGRAEDPNLVSVIDRPVVTIVTPNSGPSEGGTAVTISGSNFKDGATVTFGGMAASNVVFVSSSQITCSTPAHIPETVDVRVTNPDAQYGLLLNGFTFVSTAAQISMPNTGGGTGNIVTVPVNAANINGMLAASLTINFDPAVLSVQSASTGTLTAGWAFASNLVAPGQYRLSMSSTSAVSGSGTLANIEFEVIGAPGSSSALTITNILLNDGAIAVELTDGLFSVDDVFNVSGLVSYWNGGAPVPGTTLTLTGDQVYNAMSGADGNYTIQGAAIDAYTLTPSKSDGDNEISAYDASFALQHDVGLVTLTGNQALAADVNSNGAITSMDAAYILQKSISLISLPFPGSGVVWKFNPAERTIAELSSNFTGQNFTGVLLGDISGNWTDPGEAAQATAEETRAASAVITIPDVPVLPGGTVDIPIALEIMDAGLLGADITFTYDPAHVSISNVRAGSLAPGWSLVSNLTKPGVVRIAMAGAIPITTSGELVLFSVTALGTSGTQSALTLTQGELNEVAIPSTLVSGSVYIAVPAAADFSASLTSGIAPLSVSFTNLSTGDWTSSSWNFGDGATSTENNPTHQYATAGTYTVSLTVTGSGGSDTETKTDYITVYDPASANFSATPTNGIAPLSVNFTNLSTGDWTSSSWNFGDGVTSTENNPTHQYNTAGTYTVSLSVTGLGGSDTETKTAYITTYESVSADFSGTPTSGITPLSVDLTNLSSGDWTSSSWDFGDGSTSTDNNPTHQYNTAGTFTVSLNVSGPGGSDTETKTNYITVYEPVSADFSGTPTSGIVPLSVGFTNLSTGDWSTSSWSFGDGETSTEDNPTHQYLSAGTYTVNLTVTGPGGSDTETKTDFITIYEPVAADFSGIPTSGIAPLSVSFTNLSTGDWSTSSWSFGDGETSTENNPTHQYLTAGTYSVSLTVTGPGGSDSETKLAYLTVFDPVNADFSATPTSGAAPLLVSFANLSTGVWTTSSWNFGDGATSTENNPSHQYATPGTYTVSLTVTGAGGSDTETKTDYIQVSTLNISGQVLYWNASKAIPDAQITMTGDNPYSDTTDSAGAFSISGILSGSYTLTPAKIDDFNGITAYDAALVLRHAADLSPLIGYQATAADVDESGTISSMDASYILQKSVGLITDIFPGASSMWHFSPENFSYPTLTENQSNQDFTALLLGDVSGSWIDPAIPTGINDLPSQRQTTTALVVESKTVLAGETFNITIDLTNMGEDILAGDIILTYDPTVIEINNVSSGTLVSDWPIAFNLVTPGLMRIAIADTNPAIESGEFIIISATAVGLPGEETEIGFTLGSLNEGAVSTELLPGIITIDNGEVPPNKIYLPLIVK